MTWSGSRRAALATRSIAPGWSSERALAALVFAAAQGEVDGGAPATRSRSRSTLRRRMNWCQQYTSWALYSPPLANSIVASFVMDSLGKYRLCDGSIHDTETQAKEAGERLLPDASVQVGVPRRTD